MLVDFANYLLKNKKFEKIKINQRIVDILTLLVRIGKIKLDKFQNLPEVTGLFTNVSSTTKYRDLKKMEALKLINFVKDNEELFIEPNFQILEIIKYNV